ncbi:hypothetical protein [Flavobacterium sp.]|uniref:hypothetical protein n=1 Tax=Flavobacterium sp. TaxID=239 RepID=UPI0037BF1BBF
MILSIGKNDLVEQGRAKAKTTATTKYGEMTYTTYNLFQLYDIITETEVKIRCPFCKDSLIKIIEEKNLNMDCDPDQSIYWYPSIIGFNEYMICLEDDFNLREDDILFDKEDNCRYKISSLYYEDKESYYDSEKNKEDLMVSLKNLDTENYIQMCVNDLIKILETRNVSIVFCAYLDY